MLRRLGGATSRAGWWKRTYRAGGENVRQLVEAEEDEEGQEAAVARETAQWARRDRDAR